MHRMLKRNSWGYIANYRNYLYRVVEKRLFSIPRDGMIPFGSNISGALSGEIRCLAKP